MPLKMVRRYPPYHEAEDMLDARAAVVALRLDGWSAKAIAGYLGIHHATVYRTLARWKERGLEGLVDGSPGGWGPRHDSSTKQHRDPGSKELRHELEAIPRVAGHVVRKITARGLGLCLDAHLKWWQISLQCRPV